MPTTAQIIAGLCVIILLVSPLGLLKWKPEAEAINEAEISLVGSTNSCPLCLQPPPPPPPCLECPQILPCPECPVHPPPQEPAPQITLQKIFEGYDDFYEREALFRRQKFLGVMMMQDPNDALVITEILFDVKPDLLIETGTHNGGSSLYWAAHLDHFMGNDFKIVTVDIVSIDDVLRQFPSADPRQHRLFNDHVTTITRSSTAPETIAEIEEYVKNATRVMVLLDSNHDYSHVIEEMRLYHKYVSKGSYMIVEDTKIDRITGAPGPMKAATEWIDGNQDKGFEVDKGREYLGYTQHKNGFLKKK